MSTTQNIQTPLVSFIITTYNLSTYLLQRCLRSIYAIQLSGEEREVILVDDGSDNYPIAELESLFEGLIYLRINHQGVSAARNMGLRVARGKFVQFIDGDDELLSSYNHILQIAREQEPDIVSFYHQGDGGIDDFVLPVPVSGSEFMRNNNLRGAVWSRLFRRGIVGSLSFTVGTQYAEDEEFTAQLYLRADKVYPTQINAYLYHHETSSVSNQKSSESIDKRLEDTEAVILRLQGLLDHLPEALRQGMERRIAQLTMDYLYQIIRLTHSSRRLNTAIERLHQHNLYPLPDRNYTKKYMMFRRMIKTRLGRMVLMFMTK